MMSMALETAYHGLSFTRAFGFLRNRREGSYSAKIGLGDGAKRHCCRTWPSTTPTSRTCSSPPSAATA